MRTIDIERRLAKIEDHEKRLRLLCNEVYGRPVDSPVARRVMELADWSQYYPVADRIDGQFIGLLAASDDEGYANVNDWYVVPMHSLTAKQRARVRETGYPE